MQNTLPTNGPRRRMSAAGVLLLMILFSSGCVTERDGEGPVATDVVRIPGPWVFEPAKIEVANGTTVTWTNDGGQAHTVTFDDLGHDETIQPGGRLELVFPEPGTYTYVCRFHLPDMTGEVHVYETATTAPATENQTAQML